MFLTKAQTSQNLHDDALGPSVAPQLDHHSMASKTTCHKKEHVTFTTTCHFHVHMSFSRAPESSWKGVPMSTSSAQGLMQIGRDTLRQPTPHRFGKQQKAANQATHPICSTSLMNWRQMDLVSDDLASSSTNSLPTSKKKTLKPTSQHTRSRFPRQAISAPRDITRTETPQGTRAGAPHIPSQQARSRFPRKRSLRRVTSHEVKLRKAHALRHHEPKPTRPL